MSDTRDRASATAETAVALPALVLVLAVCLWGLGLAAATLRCAEAARAAARLAARGESEAAVTAAARRAAGDDAAVSVTGDGALVTVRVTVRPRPPFPALRRLVPAPTVSERATAQVEPRGGAP